MLSNQNLSILSSKPDYFDLCQEKPTPQKTWKSLGLINGIADVNIIFFSRSVIYKQRKLMLRGYVTA